MTGRRLLCTRGACAELRLASVRVFFGRLIAASAFGAICTGLFVPADTMGALAIALFVFCRRLDEVKCHLLGCRLGMRGLHPLWITCVSLIHVCIHRMG